MPLQPVTQTLRLPLDTPADAEGLLLAVQALTTEANPLRRARKARDLADHLLWLGAVRPDLAAVLRPSWSRLPAEAITLLGLSLGAWLPLLGGADDVNRLADALDREPDGPWLPMLAAIGTPLANDRLADLARRHRLTESLARMGIAVPPHGPAERRFTPSRCAVRKVAYEGTPDSLTGLRHPIGLPLGHVAAEGDEGVRWHYLSLDLDGLEGLPPLETDRLHLVGPVQEYGWTLFARIGPDGRYRTQALELDEDEEFGPIDNDAEGELGVAELLPFDDRLVYSNGHVLLTPGVQGTVGGPPLGLYTNPVCPDCGKLMFHVLTADAQIREHGDGFRSLFVCERCGVAACDAAGYN